MLRLADGRFEWGRILSHDPDGLVFGRLENGGRARLPWSFLHPEEDLELRTRFGYVDLSGEEVLAEAERIVTNEGVEVIGRIVERTADAYLVKTSTGTIPVPKSRVNTAPTIVRVNALLVWTRAELYANEAGQVDLTTAGGNVALAKFCERILDFAHAAEHWKKVAELDPAYQKDEVVAGIVRAQEKAARQDQIDWLADVDDLVGKKKFDEALARAEAFTARFPDSPLIPDAKKKKDRTTKARERYLQERVAQLWPLKAANIARAKSSETSFEAVLAYLDGQMSKDVLDAVTAAAQAISKEASSDVVRRLWAARKKERWLRASYGLGTWLLGKDAALKGSEEEAPAKEPVTAADKERADLEKKLKSFLQNQEMARKSKSSADQKDERDTAWKELPGVARAGWILSYYAENSGDFETMKKPLFGNCRECGGTGTRILTIAGANVAKSEIGKQSNEQVIECPTCHGLGVIRRISYR
jgi:Ni,Fe-hydrogenase III component G